MGEDAGRDQSPKGTTTARQCPGQWETPGLEGVRTGPGEGGSHTAPTAARGTEATPGCPAAKFPGNPHGGRQDRFPAEEPAEPGGRTSQDGELIQLRKQRIVICPAAPT